MPPAKLVIKAAPMISGMVETFREMQLRLAETLEQYETQEFKALDGGIASLFQAICQHVPRDSREARAMLGFFLDLIEANDAGDNRHLIERVRAIIETSGGLCPPAMEIANGAGI